MRRISLSLALLGAVTATGCGSAASSQSGGAKGVQDGTFMVTVQNTAPLDIKGGKVVSAPAGIDCGVGTTQACSAAFPLGTVVVLTATASGIDASVDLPYQFFGWAGSCTGEGTCTLDGNADKYLVAMFGGQRTGHPNWTDGAVHGPKYYDYVNNVAGALNCTSCHGANLTGQGLALSCATCHPAPSDLPVTAAGTGLKVAVQSISPAPTNPIVVQFTLKDSSDKVVDVTGIGIAGGSGKSQPMPITMALVSYTTDAFGNVLPYKNPAGTGNPATTSVRSVTGNTTSGTLTSGYQGGVACTTAAPCTCTSAAPCNSIVTVGTQAGAACTTAAPCTCSAATPCGPALATANAPGALTLDPATGVYTYTFATTVAYPASPGSFALWIATTRQENLTNAFDPKKFVAVNQNYSFDASTGAAATPREIVNSASCAKCHDGFPAEANATGTGWGGFHSGARVAGPYCAVCHYDGRGTLGAADSKVFVHRIHGAEQIELPTSLWFHGIGVTYPQTIKNCKQCHPDTAQGRQYKTRPTRAACQSCHYAVSFIDPPATGLVLHAGGAQADDTLCAGCHTPAYIDSAHLPVLPPDPMSSYATPAVTTGTVTRGYTQGTGTSLAYCTTAAPCTCTVAAPCAVMGSNANTNAAYIAAAGAVPTGADVIGWEIGSVSRDASKHPVISFKFKQNGADVAFNACGSGGVATTTQLMNNFVGSPSVYFVWAAPQDGIAAPADFNASASAYVKDVCNKNSTAAATSTIAGPDASGFYTITITNVVVSDAATMLTGGVGYSYSLSSAQPLTQTNVPAYPYVTATKIGGLVVPAPNVTKVATGYTGRRAVVANARCNNCHAQLGVAPTFHAGQRNDAPTCSWCHTPNRTSSAWSANAKDFIHGIHGAAKRTVPFNWHSACPPATRYDATTNACVDVDVPTTLVAASPWFANVEYPGSSCLDCHEPGTYDFSANAAAVPNLLPSTVATGTFTAGISISPYVTLGADYGTGFAYANATGIVTAAAPSTLATSPITAACFACHDSASAKGHMESHLGQIYKPRSVGSVMVNESCLDCHGAGKMAPISEVHR